MDNFKSMPMLPGYTAPLQIKAKAKAKTKSKARAAPGSQSGRRSNAADHELASLVQRRQLVTQQKQVADEIAATREEILDDLESSASYTDELSDLRMLLFQRFETLLLFCRPDFMHDMSVEIDRRWKHVATTLAHRPRTSRSLSPDSHDVVKLVNNPNSNLESDSSKKYGQKFRKALQAVTNASTSLNVSLQELVDYEAERVATSTTEAAEPPKKVKPQRSGRQQKQQPGQDEPATGRQQSASAGADPEGCGER